ncbi:hypothetical protein AGMMS50276_23080 [Synergistales bacterium]|nr:hypothetical protein AGMMS50276_23080 [Synergistales bacterium]
MKKLLFALICVLVFVRVAVAAEKVFKPIVPAEVIEEKAFVRMDHNNESKRVLTLKEGDALELLAEWRGNDPYPWYKVKTNKGERWIYGKVVRRLDAETETKAATQTPNSAAFPDVGVLKSDKNYVTVVAIGQGTDRAKALEQAWIDAVRLAVGSTISSKSELNNDEFAENTIAHSRGVIESFDVLKEQNDGKRTSIAIQAKVHKEILTDAAKTYTEAQIVKASAGEAAKAQLKAQSDAKAKETTAKDKQQSGTELLKEVLEGYSADTFYSATLDPEVYYNKTTQKSYIKISEKFNEDLFWKELLPKLRAALDGVATKKEKMFYSDKSRQANQQLAKNKRVEESELLWWDSYSHDVKDRLYTYYFNDFSHNQYYSQGGIRGELMFVFVPDNNSSCTVYHLQHDQSNYVSMNYGNYWKLVEVDKKSDDKLYSVFLRYLYMMDSPVVFSIAFLDKDRNEIHSQVVHREPPLSTVYRSFSDGPTGFGLLNGLVGFAPGFVKKNKNSNNVDVFLDSKGFEIKVDVELDADDLQKVDSMKFEVVFENQ